MRRGSPTRQEPHQWPSRPRKALPKLGKAGKAWQAAWREIKPKLERAGITRCEVRGPNCTPDIFLTPMHSLKRRNANTPELLREVIIGCRSCHAEAELLPESDMCAKVRAIIAAREVSV